jgi:citrate lyase subunit alpha/citrate CoA-transferase
MKDGKIVNSLIEAVKLCGLKDGMTLSFHHHLRNGDFVLNRVMEVVSSLGIKDIHLAPSALYPVHEPLLEHIRNKTVTALTTNYMQGPLAEAISRGDVNLKQPVRFMSHGGRARAIDDGDLEIDIAFIAAPSSDSRGNMNGFGPSGCGSLGYAFPDAAHAGKVIAVTDHPVAYPLNPVSIDETRVDCVAVIDKIGDPRGIVSGTTRITRDPIGQLIAQKTAELIKACGFLENGFSFQTGAGGTSLAAAAYVSAEMAKASIKGSFCLGGITGPLVDMLRKGLFETLLDVQDFDLEAIESLRENSNHQEISASRYANPHVKSCAVDGLDVVVLGAAEIDTQFNVNVLTDSNGLIIGGSGGHCDAAAGAKLTIIATNLLRTRIPIVLDRVITVTTPGSTVDAVVTERGIAVNPESREIHSRLKGSGIPLMSIQDLKKMAEKIAGKPQPVKFSDEIVAEVEYRDGTVIDTVRRPLME